MRHASQLFVLVDSGNAQCAGAAKHEHFAESMRVGREFMLALEKQRKIFRRHDEDGLPPAA